MLITSLGIFGYLSKANIEVNLVGDGNNLELSILDVRIGAEEDKITRLQERLSGLDPGRHHRASTRQKLYQ